MDKRKLTQGIAALGLNSHFKGFWEGRIYQGGLKKICVPGLNCYSCPGALGACPIGALQAVAGSVKYGVSLYVAGFLMLTGGLFGRLICGWLCPFGWIQELLHRIPSRKVVLRNRVSTIAGYLKYLVLLLFVLLLPILLADEFGLSTPFFCEYICPAGTLEGGIPLISMNELLKGALGLLFEWKMFILVVVVLTSVFLFRPFCRVLCPLGAIYSLFNGISFFRYAVDTGKCTGCGSCARQCKLQLEVVKQPNHPECIRCGECAGSCPSKAITTQFHWK